jgi:hypothetical protein
MWIVRHWISPPAKRDISVPVGDWLEPVYITLRAIDPDGF